MIFSVPVKNGVATVEASRNVAEKLGLQSLVPPATQFLGSWQVGPVRYEAPSRDSATVFVQVAMQPASIGPVTATYRINGQQTVRTRQFIVP